MYTISRNGRLNAWECDTKLDGLIKSRKPDEQVVVIGEDADELSTSFAAATKMDVDVDSDKDGQDDDDVKFTIKYKKIAKYD